MGVRGRLIHAGNLVRKFPKFANPCAFPLSRYPATDANGLSIRVYTDLAIEYRGRSSL